MNIYEILTIILFILAAAAPIVLTVMNIRRSRKKKKSLIFELIAYIIGMLLVVFDYSLLEPVYYKDALNFELGPVFHEAFNRYHLATALVFFVIGLICYFILKFYKKGFPPLTEAILLSGMFIGMITGGFAVVHLSAAFRADLATAVLVICIYLFFFNYFMLNISLLIGIAKDKAAQQKDIQYRNAFLQACGRFLMKGSNIFVGALILMLPILIILILVLTLFGQEPDSAIKAFTQTSDWLLSAKVSPPAIESGGHYLCTVSLRGHKRLVKPIRFGIRNGRKIIVNRQLCVANAFEQLIMERLPGFHRKVRNFYDSYGYPVSKLIRKAWVADIVYIVMKPLEWMFLIVLYTFDKRPEDRIAQQYLGQMK